MRTEMCRRGLSRLLAPVLFVGVLAAAAPAALAAPVTWGAATNIAADTDVSTNGTLVGAFNFNGPAVAINGVSFQAFAISNASNSSTVGNFTFKNVDTFENLVPAVTATAQSLSPNYTTFLNSAVGIIADRQFTLSMGGLTVGKKYEFQTWVSNSARQNGPNFLFKTDVSDTNGNNVQVYAGDDGTTTGGAVIPGQYVIGTFTANSTTQDILFSNGEINGWVNGFQLRELAAVNPPGGPGQVPLPLAAWAGVAMGAAVVGRRVTRKD